MASEARTVPSAARSSADVDKFKTIAIFRSLGLLLSLLAALSYGLVLGAL
jgi:hypothetical protein